MKTLKLAVFLSCYLFLWNQGISATEIPGEREISLENKSFLSDGSDLDLARLVGGLRAQDHLRVNIEGSAFASTKKISLAKGAIPVLQLLDSIKKAIGFDYSINGSVITFVDPDVKQLGQDYSLDAKIDDLALNNVTAMSAIKLVQLKTKVNVFADPLDHSIPLKFSLHLTNISVRDALDKIAEAAQNSGWISTTFPREIEPGEHRVTWVVM